MTYTSNVEVEVEMLHLALAICMSNQLEANEIDHSDVVDYSDVVVYYVFLEKLEVEDVLKEVKKVATSKPIRSKVM